MSLGEIVAVGETAEENVASGFDGAPTDVGPTFAMRPVVGRIGSTSEDLAAYLDNMVKLLRQDSVRFPNNKQMMFVGMEPIFETRRCVGFHAGWRWVPTGATDADRQGAATVGVVIGPQYGPLTAKLVEDLIKPPSH